MLLFSYAPSTLLKYLQDFNKPKGAYCSSSKVVKIFDFNNLACAKHKHARQILCAFRLRVGKALDCNPKGDHGFPKGNNQYIRA